MLCTVSSPPKIETALADEEEKNGSSTAVNTGNSAYRQERSFAAAAAAAADDDDDIPVDYARSWCRTVCTFVFLLLFLLGCLAAGTVRPCMDLLVAC